MLHKGAPLKNNVKLSGCEQSTAGEISLQAKIALSGGAVGPLGQSQPRLQTQCSAETLAVHHQRIILLLCRFTKKGTSNPREAGMVVTPAELLAALPVSGDSVAGYDDTLIQTMRAWIELQVRPTTNSQKMLNVVGQVEDLSDGDATGKHFVEVQLVNMARLQNVSSSTRTRLQELLGNPTTNLHPMQLLALMAALPRTIRSTFPIYIRVAYTSVVERCLVHSGTSIADVRTLLCNRVPLPPGHTFSYEGTPLGDAVVMGVLGVKPEAELELRIGPRGGAPPHEEKRQQSAAVERAKASLVETLMAVGRAEVEARRRRLQ